MTRASDSERGVGGGWACGAGRAKRGPAPRALAIAVVAGAAIAVWSCTVNTKTDKLACTVQADCTGGRACEGGFCVVDPNAKLDAAIDAKDIDAAICPAACGSCDFQSGTCMITGAGSDVTCPAGWNCAITCTGAGACGDIACTDAASCTVDCTAQGSGSGSGSAGTACGNLTCGTGRCTQTCEGSGACGTTSCASSCKCDVTCNPLLGACGTMTCPIHANRNCTTGMVPGAACDSQAAMQCHSC